MKIACCWLYAITKYGYPPSIPDTFRVLEEMAALGFQYIELEGVGPANMRAVADARHELKRRCDDLGLRVINFCPILPDAVSLDPTTRQQALDLFKLGVEVATHLGCELIQVDSFTPPLTFIGETPYKEAIRHGQQFRVQVDPAFRWEALWEVLVDSTRRFATIAHDANLRLCMEPRVGEIISNTDAMLRLMDAVGDDNFFAVLDTGHQHAQKEILPLSVEKLGNRIAYLHVSDNNGRTNEHRELGQGTVDWEGVFTALKKHAFEGYVGVDIGRVEGQLEDLDGAYHRSKSFLENLAERISL
jgi:sugar phosphate isomerase/epimerase